MKSYLKYIVLGVILCSAFGFSSASFDVSDCEKKTFIVTAYYSPKAGQEFYYKPSFLQERILNGEGYVGASGKKVFNGMLAAPASYSFGTVVYFPEWGIGEVADRGGAIVQAGQRGHSYDRIDVWMGEGEEGLIRALTFGKKTVVGYVCKGMSKKNIKFGINWDKVPTLKHFFDMAIWIQQLNVGREDVWVLTLQKYLTELDYMYWKHNNGKYDARTKRALCRYQVKMGIVGKWNSSCGTYGKLTRYKMKLDVQKKGLLPKDLYATTSFDTIINHAKNYNTKSVTSSAPSNTSVAKKNVFQFYRPYSKNQQNGEIKILQEFLKSESLYKGDIDGVYSSAVIDAVYDFQLKYGLLTASSPFNLRGYFGPGTRRKVNQR